MKKGVVAVSIALISLTLILLSMAWFGKEGRDTSPSFEELSKGFIKREGKAPTFTLIDQDGKRLSLEDLRGKVVVMTYIYTSCRYTCPLLEARLLDLQDIFKDRLGKDLVFISLSFDPERDTPPVLKRYARMLGADPVGWFFLTGPKEEVKKVLRAYSFFYEKQENGDFIHENRFTIIGKNGEYLYDVRGITTDTKPLKEKLEEILKGV